MGSRLRSAAASAAVLALAWAAVGGVARGAPAPIPGSDFVARLEAARRLAEAGAAAPSPRRMDDVRQALGLPLDVAVPGGTQHVPADDVLTALRGRTAEDFHHAEDELAAMEDAAKAALAVAGPDQGRIQAALGSAFGGIRTSPTLVERVRHDAWAAVVSLWQRLTGALRSLPIPGDVLAAIAVAAVGAVAVLVMLRLRYAAPETRVARARPAGPPATDWDRLVREALARGDLAAAVHARYGALLAALARRGVVPDAASLTAGEARRAVAGALPDVYPAVAGGTAAFESVAYGGSDATSNELEALAAAQRGVADR